MSFYFYDLSGGINLAQSKTTLGLDTKKVFWAQGENVEIYQNRGIIRQNGNILLCDIGENVQIIGLFGFEKNARHYLLINTALGKLYMFDYAMGVLTCLKSDFSASQKVTYAKFLDGVCVSNGIDEPVFVDIDDKKAPVKPMDTTNSRGEKIKGLAMCAYNGRLWLAQGSTLYYSALGRYDDWKTPEDAGFISNFHSDFSKITALCPYREYLAIYKENQIYFLSGFSEDEFALKPFANAGTPTQNAVLTIDNKQYFFNNGVFHLAQVGELGQIVLSSDITTPVKPYINGYKKILAHQICVVPYEEKSQIWFFIPQKNAQNLSTVLIWDFLNKAWYTRKIPQEISCAGKFAQKPVTATHDGKIYLEDTSNSFAGEPIKFAWKSPFFALNSPNKRKVVDKFNLLLDDAYDNVFEVFVQKNYDENVQTDVQNIKTHNPLNLVWDEPFQTWADEGEGENWAKAVDAKERVLISDKNFSVQICVQGSENTQNCCIIGLEFGELDFN